MTGSELVLTLEPTLPVAAAVVVGALRLRGDRSAALAIAAGGVSFAAASLVVLLTGIGHPFSAMLGTGQQTPVIGLEANRLTALLALLTTGVGMVVQVFASRNLKGDLREHRFFALASLLTASTTTVAIAGTLVLMCIGWIVAGIALASLVTHRATWGPAQRASRRTLASLWVGDSALLVATVLAVAEVGPVDLRSPEAAARQLSTATIPGLGWSVLAVVAVLLTVAGISRSAQMPIHQWLPSTIAAPTPVSALLHAGVVNGAGMLLVRLAPIFGANPVATNLAFAAGAATTCYATLVMLVRCDVKGNLAWSTAGQMGYMTAQASIGAFTAALFHIAGHGMYKAALFLGAGNSVTTHLNHDHRPKPAPLARPVRLAMALVAPGVAIGLAYLVMHPHLSTAARVLVTVFAWATAARAIEGWLRHPPFQAAASLASAAAGAFAGVFAYMAGLTILDQYVASTLPIRVPHPVATATLVTVIVVVAAVAGIVWFVPSRGIHLVRNRLYSLVLSSAPVASRLTTRGSSAGVAPVPHTRYLGPTPEMVTEWQ
jgi:NADH:ubiquinone oxidoreductase subunit 5 (subunit L)/multisubunit Na+/H+ antiporter MnhA subunit